MLLHHQDRWCTSSKALSRWLCQSQLWSWLSSSWPQCLEWSFVGKGDEYVYIRNVTALECKSWHLTKMFFVFFFFKPVGRTHPAHQNDLQKGDWMCSDVRGYDQVSVTVTGSFNRIKADSNMFMPGKIKMNSKVKSIVLLVIYLLVTNQLTACVTMMPLWKGILFVMTTSCKASMKKLNHWPSDSHFSRRSLWDRVSRWATLEIF